MPARGRFSYDAASGLLEGGFVYATEAFPTSVRAGSVGLGTAISHVGAILALWWSHPRLGLERGPMMLCEPPARWLRYLYPSRA
jgi:hypothetical protein